ncbi:hypothetical protein [Erwinia typographi]|uniref:hypothetical protein n=1 Tax=Erwinia typographi TaxID=371042 RepID=UPI00068DD426|nr:hypothetical protein [Erwinia typographi]
MKPSDLTALNETAQRISIVSSSVPLESCPECGTSEVRLNRVSRFAGGDDAYYVACTICEPRQFPDSREDAVRDWNQRQIIDLREVLNASR